MYLACVSIYVYVFVCVCVQVCYSVHVKVRGQFVGVSFLLPPHGSRNQKAVTVGYRLLHPLSHLALP